MKRYFAIIGLVFCLKAYSQSIDITKEWRLNIGDTLNWANVSYNDSHWKMVKEINRFEASGYPEFRDYGWARKRIVFPSTMKAAAVNAGYFYISLGKIFDADQVFFNGKLVGQSGGMPPADKLVERGNRIYKVRAKDILWDAENLIAIRVFSNFHNGGLQGEDCHLIIPSEDIFHLSQKSIPSFPLRQDQESYVAVTNISNADKEKAMKAGGLTVKMKLPEYASVFYNDKFIGKASQTAEQSFFVPAVFFSGDNKNKIAVYINRNDGLESILLSTPTFSAVPGNEFELMQVNNLRFKKGSLNGKLPVTVSVNVFNTTNTGFQGKLTLAIVTDINNIQQSSSQSIRLDKLQNKEIEFTLTPDFSGVYQVNYILQKESGEKMTGTLAKGERS